MNTISLPRSTTKKSLLSLLICLFLSSQTILSMAYSAQAAQPECTYIIPHDVEKVDGLVNYTSAGPGDVLCLPAGIRGNIQFMNLHGSPDAPITVRNSGGKTIITGDDFLSGGMGVIGSSYLRITGTGVGEQCGALYSSEEQDCGIEINQAFKGVKVNTSLTETRDIEIDHIAIQHTSTISETRGIAIHPDEGQTIFGFKVHDNYIVETSAEGIYLGTEPNGRPFEILGKMENVDVGYNLIENIGFDGIKIKQAVNNVKVHNNIIRDVGLAQVEDHQAGIKLVNSLGDYYNNYISTACEGIKIGRTLVNPSTRYFNNVIVGAKCEGINTDDDNASIFNNTVVLSDPIGIQARGENARVFDNIVVGTTGTPIDGKKLNMFNNLTGPVSVARFVDPDAGDFNLLPDSPAIDAGRIFGIFPASDITFDIQDRSRPVGRRTDLGAYEFQFSYNGYLPFIFFVYQP